MATFLGNINLVVSDVGQSLQFYTEVLGLMADEARSNLPGFALLRAGGCTLTLQDGPELGVELSPAESVELGFAVDDVEAVRARLVDYGLEVGEIQQMGWGASLDLRDEDGYRLTVYKLRD